MKRGNPREAWPRMYETPCCDSVLRIEPDDIKRNVDYTGAFSSYYIDCPVCGKQPDVPESWKGEALRYEQEQARRS